MVLNEICVGLVRATRNRSEKLWDGACVDGRLSKIKVSPSMTPNHLAPHDRRFIVAVVRLQRYAKEVGIVDTQGASNFLEKISTVHAQTTKGVVGSRNSVDI